MEFYMPTHVYSEKDCIENHSDVFCQYGKKALVVTGKKSAKKNGSLDAVVKTFAKNGIEYVIFDDIEENPSVETVMKAREFGVAEKVDFVVGIGGGSPMDAAKAIALMIKNSEADRELLFTRVKKEYLPVIEIPTTAGTGSEVTPWSILTIHEKRTKGSIAHSIYPAVALIDSEYLRSVPRYTFVSTAIDTLAHLIESHLVVRATDYSRIYTSQGLRMWGSLKESLLEDRFKAEDYETMMQACTLGGIAITHTSTGLPHTLSYKFTYETGLAHGMACGLTLAGFVREYPDERLRKEVLDYLGFENADVFDEYLKMLIGEHKVTMEIWKEAVDGILANDIKLATYPKKIDGDTIMKYLRLE